MSEYVTKGNHPINSNVRGRISSRYKAITKAVNNDMWNTNSDTAHSRYVGSYGRGTAINVSDLDVLHELPQGEYEHFTSLNGNGPSRLLQTVKNAILGTYPKTDIKGDGQVVVVKFSDGMKFEILPAFRNEDGSYIYPDTHMGGHWLPTNPEDEQNAMANKNHESNGLLFDTCRHIRYVRGENFSSYHLSGILIDSFVYEAIGNWHWLREGEKGGENPGVFEQKLLDYYNDHSYYSMIYTPGSYMNVDTDDWDILGKVLNKMV